MKLSALISTLLCITLQVSGLVTVSNTTDNSNCLLKWNSIQVLIKRHSILSVDSGKIYKGRLLAVLGPSGSGKSTFLNSIGGRHTHRTASSDVVLETTNMPLDQSNIAFVYQDDSFFPMLTVEETLLLSYRLHKMSIHNDYYTESHVNSNNNFFETNTTMSVFAILHSLGLHQIAQSYVGDIQTRGISGGERKRLSLACELVGNPLLLVADEPTSGLDSFQSLHVIELLSDLAKKRNMAVVITVHQPSSIIWNLLDDILLLTPGGKVAYFGPRLDMQTHFERLGYTSPIATNPAEFYLDLVSTDYSSTISIHKSQERINHIIKAFKKIHDISIDHDIKTFIVQKKHIMKSFHPFSFINQSIFMPIIRISLLFRRAITQTIRDYSTNIVRLGTSVILAFILAAVYGKQGNLIAPESVSNRVNIIAQGVINIGMLSMIKTLQMFKKERSIIDRERRSHKYNAFEYLLAKFMAELPFDGLIALSFGAVLHWRTELQQAREVFLLVCGIHGLVSSTLGMSIGALFPSGESALAIGPALMVIYIMMGAIGPAGLQNTLPSLLAPIRQLSPMNHACKALCVAEFKDVKLNIITSSLSNGFKIKSLLSSLFGKNPMKSVPTGNEVLAALGIGEASFASSVKSLLRLFTGHIAIALFGLIFFKPH